MQTHRHATGVHYLFRYQLFLFLYFVSGAAGFFVKHVQTGMCINDTSIIQSKGPDWGNVSFVELSDNCLDPAAQFRFRDNGAMLNLKRQGCLFATYKNGFGYFRDMFYIYVDSVSLDRAACAQKPDENIYRAITQTPWGGLSVYYSGFPGYTSGGYLRPARPFQMWCAVSATYQPLADNAGIDPYIELTRDCNDTEDKRFNFGKFFYIHHFVS